MTELRIEKSLSWEFETEVNQICSHFFKEFDVNYFDYARFYDDGSALILYSDRNWVKCFTSAFHYIVPSVVIENGAHLWEEYIDTAIISCARNDFNHAYGITLCEQGVGYKQILNFAAPVKNSKILNIYLNRQEVLREFTNYFSDKAASLIGKLEKNRIALPEQMLSLSDDKNINLLSYEKPLESKILSKHLKIPSSIKSVSTSRELECLSLLMQGHSAKAIGRELGISFRTAETHLDALKRKLNCNTRFELLSLVYKCL